MLSKIFPENSHFLPTDPQKTQRFYKFILVDSDYVAIKHYRDQNNETIITHSTV